MAGDPLRVRVLLFEIQRIEVLSLQLLLLEPTADGFGVLQQSFPDLLPERGERAQDCYWSRIDFLEALPGTQGLLP